MTDDQFDDILKDKLDSEDVSAPDWEKMSDLLDNELDQIVDDQLDARVASAVTTEDDEAADWDEFYQKLEVLQDRTRRVVAAKLTEVLLLLLAFTIYASTSGLWNQLSSTLQPGVLMADDDLSRKLQQAASEIAPVKMPALSTATPIEGVSRLSYLTTTRDQQNNVVSELPDTNQNTSSAATIGKKHSTGRALLQKLPRKLPLLATATDDPSVLGDYVAVGLSDASSPTWIVGAGVAKNQNIILTPDDQVYEGLGGYTTVNTGLAFDLGFTRRMRAFDVSTGLRYSRKDYDPRPFSETNISANNEVLTTRIEDIQFDIVSIPLLLTYRFAQQGVVSAYIQGGLNLHGVVRAEYQVQQEEQTQSSRKAKAVEVKTASDIDDDLLLSEKEFAQGLFEGGAFDASTYLSAALSTGIEIELAQHHYLQASILYNHNFSARVGPNQDRIHTLGFRLGVAKAI